MCSIGLLIAFTHRMKQKEASLDKTNNEYEKD